MSVDQRSAIIDIGSNSVRLVVYGGPPRAPFAIFNEKVLAGLGRDFKPGGVLSAEPTKMALRALARFRHLLDMMHVDDVQVVATAAVREAMNGADFLQEIAKLGFSPLVLSGEEEARLFAVLPANLKPLVEFALLCGQRKAGFPLQFIPTVGIAVSGEEGEVRNPSFPNQVVGVFQRLFTEKPLGRGDDSGAIRGGRTALSHGKPLL